MNVLQVDEKLYQNSLKNYFQYLVDHFFKILPMKEQQEGTLPKYLESLKSEIIGFSKLFEKTDCNAASITLLSILQWMISDPDAEVSAVRREVFHAISICNKLKTMYEN